MKKGAMITILALATLAGCEPNEISFFVEHVKQQPEAPECAVTESDEFTASGTLDVSFRNSYTGWCLVTNAMMAREDLGSGIAESNGVTIDGMESYVRATNGVLLGAPEYYELELYIEPETSSVAAAVMVPYSVVDDLADEFGCPDYDAFPDGTTGGWNIGSMYAVVRFIGHTAGGKDVLTPEFSFPINVTCGTLIEWGNCLTNCSKYCEDPETSGMCQEGVWNGGVEYDCRNFYHNPDQQWVPGPGDDCEETLCNCNDCTSA